MVSDSLLLTIPFLFVPFIVYWIIYTHKVSNLNVDKNTYKLVVAQGPKVVGSIPLVELIYLFFISSLPAHPATWGIQLEATRKNPIELIDQTEIEYDFFCVPPLTQPISTKKT